MRMRKGRTEVSGRTPIARELLRFDPASFYSRGMFLEIDQAVAIHSTVGGAVPNGSRCCVHATWTMNELT